MSPYRRVLMINTGRQPFELAILATCVVSGAAGLLAPGGRSPAIVAALGELAWLWHVGLLLGGGAALLGVWLRLPTCLLVERVAMVWLSTLFLAYGTGIAFLVGNRGITSSAFTLGCGLAAATRVVQITRDLKRLKEAISNPHPATSPLLGEPDAGRHSRG